MFRLAGDGEDADTPLLHPADRPGGGWLPGLPGLPPGGQQAQHTPQADKVNITHIILLILIMRI
jgi:hypothetical protein